jgi:hypothetical protein
MTITHDAQVDSQIPGRPLGKAIVAAPVAVFGIICRWYVDAVQKRNIAKLPAHLRRDIGEIDHLSPPPPSFIAREPTSYQDLLQQAWML